MSILVFLFILTLLVLVHEWGHYMAARLCGVKVLQFAIGFGPKLFSRTHDGTEFCLCAIPLGGYVKMAGDERGVSTGAQDEFFSKSVRQRAFIVIMGPVVNLIMAYLCFWAMFMIGYADMEATALKVEPRVGQVISGSPAAEAGIEVGDKIVTIDGKLIAHWPDLQEYIVKSTANQLHIVIERNGVVLNKDVAPKENVAKDIFGKEHRQRRLGVVPTQISDGKEIVIRRYGPLQAFVEAGKELIKISAKTYQALYEMMIGLRSPKEAMGIVGMFFVIKFAITVSFSFVLHIVGVINASLAIFNLLPLIPLDGGHLLLLGIEKIRGKALSVNVDQWISRIGFGLIMTLAIYIFYVDFDRIGLIDKIIHVFKP